jgi:hypothetical protein
VFRGFLGCNSRVVIYRAALYRDLTAGNYTKLLLFTSLLWSLDIAAIMFVIRKGAVVMQMYR